MINKITDFLCNLPIFDLSTKTDRKLYIIWMTITVITIIFYTIRYFMEVY